MGRNPATEPIGSHLGRAVAEHLADLIIAVRSRMAPIEHSHRIDVNNAWLEDAEHRIRPLAEAVLKDIPVDDDSPEWLRILKDSTRTPTNQTDFFMYLLAILGAAIVGVPSLGAIGIQPLLNKAWAGAPTRPLSPADLADMVERGIRDPVAAGAVAAQSGMDPIDFADLVLDTGEPPGIVDMVRLWKRGGMDEATLNRMIAYSRIRTEWTPQVKAAFSTSMSGAAAIEAALKGVISPDEAQAYFVKDGGLAEDFAPLLQATGDAIGVQQAVMLHQHGHISDSDLKAVILHSRINPQFEPMAELLRFHYLSVYQIAEAVKTGACTPDQATEWLTQEGYPADQIAAFVGSNTSVKTVKAKEVTETQVMDLYEAHELTEAQVSDVLASLGYTTDEINTIVATYDAKRIIAAQAQAVGAVRKQFVARRIDKPTASAELDALGVSANARDHYLAYWLVELDTTFHELTAAQIGTAAKDGIIDWPYAVTRWVQMGYSTVDADILAQLHGYTPPAPAGA